MKDLLAEFSLTATEHGWRFGWHVDYPAVICIVCPKCSHMSVRRRDELATHVCPTCGRKGD